MSKRNKLLKFEEMAFFENVRECPDPTKPALVHCHQEIAPLRGRWSRNFFKNTQEIILELACGKGEYTLGLAKQYPHYNFIGLDVKGARIWRGAKTALEEDIKNAGFLRTRIEVIDQLFAEQEIAQIWMTFPDPFRKKVNRRLSSKLFLDQYAQLLKFGGLLHLKHDDDEFFDYSIESITAHPSFEIEYTNFDIYSAPLALPELEFKTFYERQHLGKGKTIKYLRARRNMCQ